MIFAFQFLGGAIEDTTARRQGGLCRWAESNFLHVVPLQLLLEPGFLTFKDVLMDFYLLFLSKRVHICR